METINDAFAKLVAAQLPTYTISPFELVLSMLKMGIITEKTVIRFLSVVIYRKELAKTICKQRPRGQKAVAMHHTLRQIPTSERQLASNIKDFKRWFKLF